MKMVLMHPPLDDPTLPYHSTAYLKGHLAANGFNDVSMRDINIEYVNYLFEADVIGKFNDIADDRRRSLERKEHLSFEEQEEYHAIACSDRFDFKTISDAVRCFRDRDAFLDFEAYSKHLNVIVGHLGFTGALSYPCECTGFLHRTRGRVSFFNLDDLFNVNLAGRACFPFVHYFQERLQYDPQLTEADLLGISIVYDHQLIHALHFARMLKARWPDKTIVLGGTSISQLYKHLKDKAWMRRFFELCDAIVIGEGETAICEIAARGQITPSDRFTNTITYDRSADKLHFPAIHYENLPALGSPIYDHQWDLYLSPERGINYAPTRGCYWNRCTFCDYGLNTNSPTSPWRERKIEQVVEDLQKVQADHGVNYVYFAVDVMAPGYLERLSDALVDRDLGLRWSAELRMERIFSTERCQKMADAGCVCVSFGMESGNQRILDLIDKGTKVAYMGETMKNFATAGIACQLMAFTDFPTESQEEKETTFKFITDNDKHWSTGGMGTFLLTGTSIIAKNPAAFGLTIIETQDADVGRAVAYRVDSENQQRSALAEEADASFDETGGIFPPVLGRPWAGGTDTLHSMIYYETYGRTFFKEHRWDTPYQVAGHELLESVAPGDRIILVHGRLVESRIDFAQIIENRKHYFTYLLEQLDIPAEPTYTRFNKWAKSIPSPCKLSNQGSYWFLLGRQCIQLDKLVYRLLSAAMKPGSPLTVEQVRRVVPSSSRDKLTDYLHDLQEKGFISLVDIVKGVATKKLVWIDESVICRAQRSHLKPPGKLVAAVESQA